MPCRRYQTNYLKPYNSGNSRDPRSFFSNNDKDAIMITKKLIGHSERSINFH
jgi:hypothetical protein